MIPKQVGYTLGARASYWRVFHEWMAGNLTGRQARRDIVITFGLRLMRRHMMACLQLANDAGCTVAVVMAADEDQWNKLFNVAPRFHDRDINGEALEGSVN